MQELLTQLITGFGLPAWLSFFLWAVVLYGMVAVVGQVAVVFMVLMERKVLAWLTQRKGPNRVGPWGTLQTVADGVKLLFKESIVGPGQDWFLFTMGPVIFFAPSFVLYALIPFTDRLVGITMPLGLLFVFALSSLSVVGIVLSGWASNNKYSLLGGMRSASQAISYEIPLVLSALGVAVAAGSLDLKTIVEAQNQGPFGLFSWYWLSILPVSFVIFHIASIAEVNRIPFDLPEAESELVSGYNTEYSGMKFAMFFLAEYASLFAMSALVVVLFFGGYYSPVGGLMLERFAGVHDNTLLGLEMVTWTVLKTYFFIFFAMIIRGTLPRLKPDQLMAFSWKFLIPLSLLNVFLVAALKMAWMTDGMLLTAGPFTFNLTYWITYGLTGLMTFIVLVGFGQLFGHKQPPLPGLSAAGP
ncbi:MAG: NADH-quinone oxidoreductase subunit NuoH [Cyanobacteria bacterium HKST-UBA06]|nr:NADH-quinone oxidoreductase subunit NuoH [Cyanobacteria bacterium HKST-UBA04]MCA9807558.1 NADH-quinone oxidoreductase subunit NuoH [Cyanobacteria bacterium HKST-UBA06]MCA9841678.1 NADH-quinone oxidoreductase subunit NuoH [Cyanobacteria bacterium HKST-UBA03]